jgi:hypothetical protein
MHDPEARDDAAVPRYEYVTHNFDAINHAIDADADRRNLMFSLYLSERSANKAQTFIHIACGISLIVLSVGLVWWLLSPSRGALLIGPDTPASTPSAVESLELLARAAEQQVQSVDAAERAFIDTSFTVFSRVILPSGEYVVTGRTFAPDNLREPTEQYCYLEKSAGAGELSGLPLAVVVDRKWVPETGDDALLALARRHCQFSLN